MWHRRILQGRFIIFHRYLHNLHICSCWLQDKFLFIWFMQKVQLQCKRHLMIENNGRTWRWDIFHKSFPASAMIFKYEYSFIFQCAFVKDVSAMIFGMYRKRNLFNAKEAVSQKKHLIIRPTFYALFVYSERHMTYYAFYIEAPNYL